MTFLYSSNPCAALNTERLRAEVHRLHMTQLQFAEAIRDAGRQLGEPNRCTKRLVQKWLSGEFALPVPSYQRALTHVTGLPIEVLCSPIAPRDPGTTGEYLSAILGDLIRIGDEIVDLRTVLDPASTSEQVREVNSRHLAAPRLVGARLRDARTGAGYSQRELADEIRITSRMALGVVHGCSKRLVQKWEKEKHILPHPLYQALLEVVLDTPFANLCEPVPLPASVQAVTGLTRIAIALDSCCARLAELRADLDYGS